MKKKVKLNHDVVTFALVVLLYAVVAFLLYSGSLTRQIANMLIPISVYIVLAVSLNLVVGLLGELSLGHGGFLSVGLFSGCLVAIALSATSLPLFVRLPLSMIVGGLVAMVFGFIVGLPALRLKGDYLAIVTLACGEIIKNVINVMYLGRDSKGFHFSIKDSASLNMQADGKMIIDGAKGIVGTPNQSTFVVGIIIILISLFVSFNLVNSRTGRAIMAIRDNRIAAESVGINITKYKLMAFTISAAIAGAGGVLYAHNLSTLTALPANFGYNMSIMILVFVVLGGMGSFRGSIIAAVVLTMLPEVLRGLADYRMLIYAIVLIIMMLFNWAPKAIEWREKHSFKRMFGKKEKAEEVQ